MHAPSSVLVGIAAVAVTTSVDLAGTITRSGWETVPTYFPSKSYTLALMSLKETVETAFENRRDVCMCVCARSSGEVDLIVIPQVAFTHLQTGSGS